jgi:hypothetical protein
MITFDHVTTMGLVFHGIGTAVYGERDYWPDGSYVTTEWFVIAWMPIIPLYSKRISYTQNSDYAKYDAREGFYIYETTGVHLRQAIFVYLWLASVVGPLVVLLKFLDALTKLFGDEDRAAGVCLAFAAAAFVFPYFLRRWVKRRKAEEWKRQSLGLHG